MRALVVAEILALCAFVAVAVFAVMAPSNAPEPINAVALATGPAEERWMGIFMQDAHIGYAVSRSAPTADGGRVYQQQSTFAISAMGSEQRVVAAGTAVTGPDGALQRFDFMLSSPLPMYAQGEVRPTEILLTIDQGGTPETTRIAITEPPVLSMTLPQQIVGKTLQPGLRFDVPYFDPLTRANARARVTVESPEMLPTGDTAWWLRSDFNGVETRQLVDPKGEVIREEGALGMRSQRMPREEAMAVSSGPPPDLIALTNVPVAPIPNAAKKRIVTAVVSGVPAARFAHTPPLQSVVDDRVTVSVPLLGELPELPVAARNPVEAADTEPAASTPSTHPDIVARAVAIVGTRTTRLDATRALAEFVNDYVDKVPTIGIPNGLEVLRRAEGDCNEHTALFVSLARAVNIPTRIAAGLVYAPQIGDAFYYHAWPEVRLGADDADGAAAWVPVDPTFGQFPADATHLKIVNGDLDRQIEIMGLLGKVQLKVVEAR